MNAIELITAILILWFTSWLTILLANALDIHLFLASGMTVMGVILIAPLIGFLIKGRKTKDSDNESTED